MAQNPTLTFVALKMPLNSQFGLTPYRTCDIVAPLWYGRDTFFYEKIQARFCFSTGVTFYGSKKERRRC